MNIEEVKVNDGICTGRNGTFEIKGIQVMHYGNNIRIDGVSKKKNKILNAGFSIDKDSAIKLSEVLKAFIGVA